MALSEAVSFFFLTSHAAEIAYLSSANQELSNALLVERMQKGHSVDKRTHAITVSKKETKRKKRIMQISAYQLKDHTKLSKYYKDSTGANIMKLGK